MDAAISTVGLLLCLAPGVVHGAELVSPMLSRWVVRWVLPFFGPGVPGPGDALSVDEQVAMLDAARAAAPDGKDRAAANYVFLLLFEQRQGGLAFVAVAVAVLYALGTSVGARAPLHLLLTVMSALFLLVNAHHAGVPGLGYHPRVSPHGRNVGVLFAPYWAVAAVLNGLAFLGAD